MRLFLLFILFFSSAGLRAQNTYELPAIADAVVGFHDGFNSDDSNYGSADHFSGISQPSAAGFGENTARSLVQFDFSLLPAGSTIVSAHLNLYGRGPHGAGVAESIGNTGDNVSLLQRVTSPWNEFTITWNTKPSTTEENQVTIGPVTALIEDMSIDVTQLVQDMMTDPASYGFALRLVTETPTRNLAFWSREASDPAKRPTLTVVVSGCQEATFAVMEDAVIGFHDNFNSANQNYGTADHISATSQPGVSGGENASHSLIKFDFSSIPTGAVIQSAYLDLYGRGPYGPGEGGEAGNIGNNTAYLERVTSNWAEGTVTWNTQPSVTGQNAVLLPASTAAIQDYLNIDVTQLVIDHLTDPGSFGFKLRLVEEEPTNSIAFWSTDGADATKHPSLTVTYNCQGIGIVETQEQEIAVYPNPAHSVIGMRLPTSGSTNVVSIINCLGEVVTSLDIATTSTVDVSNFASGVYVVKCSTDGITRFGKFVKL